MRHDAPILVMQRRPMIGRPDSAPRISVCHRALRLSWALDVAIYERDRDARRGIHSSYWIVAKGAPAHGPKPQRMS